MIAEHPRKQIRSVWPAILLLFLFSFVQSRPVRADDDLEMSELMGKSLEELARVKITIAGKKPQQAFDTAAATFVITQDDIRRSGYTTIPEILRMVPGVNVLRIDGSQWAVSIRGFSAVFADKLLVLIDGRSVYTPLFGGVFWNEQDTMIEDIDHIEVVRGPGAALWGANATNGVINIVTKSAADTHGLLGAANAGTEERGGGAVRYGGRIGDMDYRAYAKTFYRDNNQLVDGPPAHDQWYGLRSGFRTDTALSDKSSLTLQGDGYYGESGWDSITPSLTTLVEEREVNRYHDGANLLGRWKQDFDDATQLQVQSYYDRIDRNDHFLSQSRDTYDIDTQLGFSPFERNDFVGGLGYRIYADNMKNSFVVSVNPPARTLQLFTGFLQDEITLTPSWKAILGAKLEHNDLSGFEFQPNARTIYTFDEQQAVWLAVSRAARSPARFNHDGKLGEAAFETPNGVSVLTLSGNPDFDSENLTAYEAGYRNTMIKQLSVDFTFFYNDYDDLESAEPKGPPFLNEFDGQSFVEVPLQVENRLSGHSIGGETTVTWQASSSSRLVGGYAYLNLDLARVNGSVDTIFTGERGQTPRNEFFIRTLNDLGKNFEINGDLRYLSAAPTFEIKQYAEVNLNLIWRPCEHVELAVVGQNLIHPQQLQFASNLVDTHRTAIERGVYGKITVRY